MESNSDTESHKGDVDRTFFKTLLKKYTNISIFSALISIIFFVIFIFLAVWWVENSDLGGFGAWTFDQWNTLNFIIFAVYFIIIEGIAFLIYIAIMFVVLKYGVYDKLPEEEKARFKWDKTEEEKRRWGRKTESGGFGFFIFIFFVLFLLYDGTLETNFGAVGYNYSYWFFTWLKSFTTIMIIVAVLFSGYVLWILRQPD
jgi:hypothetical protein